MFNDVIHISNLFKSFDNSDVLKGINLNINSGDFMTLVGFSGSGKTTLLNIIGLLDDKFSGEYFFDGINVKNIKNKADFRNSKIGYVFQSFYLIDHLDVLANILLPFNYSKEKPDMDYVNGLIDELDLRHLMDKKVNVLSGGEKQRVAIARALCRKPSLLLCDEPTGNLDSRNKERVLTILQNINKKTKTTVLIVTHDESIANSANRKYILEEGVIHEI